jgi:hypothetical protein
MGLVPSLFTLKAGAITAVFGLGMMRLTLYSIMYYGKEVLPSSLGDLSPLFSMSEVRRGVYVGALGSLPKYDSLFLIFSLRGLAISQATLQKWISKPDNKSAMIRILEKLSIRLSDFQEQIKALAHDLKNQEKPLPELQKQMLAVSDVVQESMQDHAMTLYQSDSVAMYNYSAYLFTQINGLFDQKIKRWTSIEDLEELKRALGSDFPPQSEEERKAKLFEAAIEMKKWLTRAFSEHPEIIPSKKEWILDLPTYKQWDEIVVKIIKLTDKPFMLEAPQTDLGKERREVKVARPPYFLLEALAGLKR